MYLICELANTLSVYSYDGTGTLPKFECISVVFMRRFVDVIMTWIQKEILEKEKKI